STAGARPDDRAALVGRREEGRRARDGAPLHAARAASAREQQVRAEVPALLLLARARGPLDRRPLARGDSPDLGVDGRPLLPRPRRRRAVPAEGPLRDRRDLPPAE